MFLRLTITAALLFVPLTATAETPDICRTLQRRLATLPQVIGSTAEVRRHAEALRYHDDEIRHVRTEMRRARCGGSIVTFGRQNDLCADLAGALREMETARDAIAAQRAAAQRILRPSGERNAILAALQENRCQPDAAQEPVPVAVDPAPSIRDEGEVRPYSSITTLSPDAGRTPSPAAEAIAAPPPPERPYDASKPVRTVGPVFLPDDDRIDLANPAKDGAQPRQ